MKFETLTQGTPTQSHRGRKDQDLETDGLRLLGACGRYRRCCRWSKRVGRGTCNSVANRGHCTRMAAEARRSGPAVCRQVGDPGWNSKNGRSRNICGNTRASLAHHWHRARDARRQRFGFPIRGRGSFLELTNATCGRAESCPFGTDRTRAACWAAGHSPKHRNLRGSGAARGLPPPSAKRRRRREGYGSSAADPSKTLRPSDRTGLRDLSAAQHSCSIRFSWT